MAELRRIAPLLAALTLAVIALPALTHVETRVDAAYDREARGLTRGPILDTNGRPLAYTVDTNGMARRIQTVPELSNIVGYQDSRHQWHGIEARYNSILESTRSRRDWRSFFLHLRGGSITGGRLRLTIDSRIQREAERALGPNRGAVVVLNPHTGAVLAVVSRPYCSSSERSRIYIPPTCAAPRPGPPPNVATQTLLPPGSSFKIVTLSAALDTGRFKLDDIFSGADVFGPSPYFDNVTYPSNITRGDLTELTLAQALAFSDNFTFAHIGLTLGARTLLAYAHRFYIGRHIPFDLPVARSVIANGNPHPTLSEVAQSSFGAEVDRVTPLQMALIAATVANRGTMMAPHLVQDLEAPNGRVIWRYHVHALSRVMSPTAARQVTDGMVFVVDLGSGYRAQISGLNVAGKTGTAASSGYYPHAWFISDAPAYHPLVALSVLREFTGEGAEYAAPVAHRVLVSVLRMHGYRVQ